MAENFHCGFVAIVGRPNVGKSTLMNKLLGQKISITSHRPQTTRHRILGIKTESHYQAIYIDTPGLHKGARKAVNRHMNKAAKTALSDVDLIVFVIDATRWTEEDDNVLSMLRNATVPVALVINKIDLISKKEALLPLLQKHSNKMDFSDIVPVSSLKGVNIEVMNELIYKCLPEMPPVFPEDQVTDRSERFLAAEIVREKLMRQFEKELPYSIAVEIEQFSKKDSILNISAIIWVEREGQKRIIIGKKGEQLKNIGQLARHDMQRMFDEKIFLQLWVKVKEGWSDDERSLRSLGYSDEI